MKFTTEINESFVTIRVAARFDNTDQVVEYIREILDVYNRTGQKKILLQERHVHGALDASDVYVVSDAEELAQLVHHGIRVAIHASKGNWELNKQFETSMRNRSLNIRVFKRKEKAIEWLLA